MLVIHPDECIDCGVCESECPMDAIVSDTDLNPEIVECLEYNRRYSAIWSNITESKPPLPPVPSSSNALVRARYIRERNCEPDDISKAVHDESDFVRLAAVQHKGALLQSADVQELLADPEPAVRAAIAENQLIKLTDQQYAAILNDEEPNVRMALLKRDQVHPLCIEKLFSDPAPTVRKAVANSDRIHLTAQQIENGLKDEDGEVQLAFLERLEPLTQMQFNRGLKSDNPIVRAAYAKRADCTVDEDQVWLGLRDKEEDVVRAFLKRSDWTMTSEMLDECLAFTDSSSPSNLVTLALARYIEQPSNAQIEKALSHHSACVRLAILCRSNVTLSDEYVDQGLKDDDATCRARAVSLLYYKPTPAQIRNALFDNNATVRLNLAKRTDIQFSPEQIENGLNDKSAAVRAAFAARSDFTPNPIQIERGLVDSRLEVRRAFAQRSDAQLSTMQEARFQKVGFGIEKPTRIDEFDEEDPPIVQCPCCRATVIPYDYETWCEHLAFVFFDQADPLAKGPAAQALGVEEDFVSACEFDKLCDDRSLHCEETTIKGMACGPITEHAKVAFYDQTD